MIGPVLGWVTTIRSAGHSRLGEEHFRFPEERQMPRGGHQLILER